MNTDPATVRCPKCDGTIPADAPQGLCPRCVLAGAAAPTDPGFRSRTGLAAPPLEAVAAAFPQFEILGLVGLGGMGVVYKVRQPKLDRIVALKLLPSSLSADPAFAERFHREARFLARLSHPQIVSVYDFGESGGFCYLLMEFVDGVNLRQAMRAGRFTPAQALAIIPDICAALQYAHDQGVLHRDIKPENILLDAQGRVKIADFGIAKLVGDPGDPRTDLTLTQSGARLGTPHYMAPEQIEKPADVDHRADIYSLGVVFYELLTGELPLGRFAVPSAKTPLDTRVDEIVMRALAKERELRQQSAGEVKTEVEGLGTKDGPARAAAMLRSLAPGLSARFSAETRPLVLIGACVALVWLLIALVRGVARVLNAGLPAPVNLVIAVTLATAGWFVWRRRDHFLVPSGLGPTVTGPADRFLRHASGGALVVVALLVGSQVVLALGMLWAGIGLVVGFALLPVVLSLALFWFRRHRQAAQDAAPAPTPTALPAGLLRVGWFFLALGVVGLFPSVATADSSSFQLHSGSMLLFTGIALLSRSAAWRQVAVGTAGFALLLSLAGNLYVDLTARTGNLPAGWRFGIPGMPDSAGTAFLLAVVQYAAFATALWLLTRTDVRTAYGLRPQTRKAHLRKRGLICGLTMLNLLSLMVVVGHRGVPGISKRWDGGPAFEVSSPGVPGLPSASGSVPEGTLEARVEVLPPAGHATALLTTFWSNGVPIPLPAGGLVMQPGLGGPELVPVTWQLRATLQSGVWELSEPFAGGNRVRPTDSMRLVLPAEVALRPASYFGVVQPGPGERLRRWLFLSEDLPSTSTTPTWGLSVDVEPQPTSLPSPAAAAVKIATNVVGYLTSGGQTQVVSFPAEAAAEMRKQDIQIELARRRNDEARAREAVGAISPLEVAATARDLAVAEARGDGVAIAEANVKYARLVLDVTEKQHDVGKATTLDLRGAEATNTIALIELDEARRRALPPGVVVVAGNAFKLPQSEPSTIQVLQQTSEELQRHAAARRATKQRLEQLRKQVGVGLLAPRGLEILDAESAVAVAEADLANEKITRAAEVRDHAEKVAETTMLMNRAGKATDDQLMRALTELTKASEAVSAALESASDGDMEQLRGFVTRWFGKPAPAAVRDVRFLSDEGTAAEPRYLLHFHAGPGMVTMLQSLRFAVATAEFKRDSGPAWWRSAPSGGLVAYARDTKPAGCVVETLWWSRETGEVFYFRSCP